MREGRKKEGKGKKPLVDDLEGNIPLASLIRKRLGEKEDRSEGSPILGTSGPRRERKRLQSEKRRKSLDVCITIGGSYRVSSRLGPQSNEIKANSEGCLKGAKKKNGARSQRATRSRKFDHKRHGRKKEGQNRE